MSGAVNVRETLRHQWQSSHGSAVEPPPRPGLKLGTALTVCIGIVLLTVLGGLSAVQQRRAATRERVARQELLAQSLAPLAWDLEQTSRITEVRERLGAFAGSFGHRGHADHHVFLSDADGRLVAASDDAPLVPPETALVAAIPVEVPAIAGGQGKLTAWQDGSDLAREIARRQQLTWLDIGVTLVVVSLGIQLVVYSLVSRPLQRLLVDIERTENGYLRQRPLRYGAWEIRWLAWRFFQMGRELAHGASLLVAAQRQAMRLASKRRGKPVLDDAGAPLVDPQQVQLTTDSILRRYLQDRCVFLEGCPPDDPIARTDAEDVWENDVVEAERLGDMRLKARLENAALKVLDLRGFEAVRQNLETLVQSRAKWLSQVESELARGLRADRVPCVAIQHRVKHVAGVWRKMKERHLDPQEVQDVFAFRIIVADVDDCYLALEAVHQLFEPVPFRFKDYIVRPKDNGYRSLHTTLRDDSGLLFEVQIRSLQMHEAAENGDAAHWRYRAGKKGVLRLPWRWYRRS